MFSILILFILAWSFYIGYSRGILLQGYYFLTMIVAMLVAGLGYQSLAKTISLWIPFSSATQASKSYFYGADQLHLVCFSLCDRSSDWTLYSLDSNAWKMGGVSVSDCQWCASCPSNLLCSANGIHDFVNHPHGNHSRSTPWKFPHSIYGAA